MIVAFGLRGFRENFTRSDAEGQKVRRHVEDRWNLHADTLRTLIEDESITPAPGVAPPEEDLRSMDARDRKVLGWLEVVWDQRADDTRLEGDLHRWEWLEMVGRFLCEGSFFLYIGSGVAFAGDVFLLPNTGLSLATWVKVLVAAFCLPALLTFGIWAWAAIVTRRVRGQLSKPWSASSLRRRE